MAHLRPADGLRGCLLIGVDRKSSAHPQNDVNDPKQNSANLALVVVEPDQEDWPPRPEGRTISTRWSCQPREMPVQNRRARCT